MNKHFNEHSSRIRSIQFLSEDGKDASYDDGKGYTYVYFSVRVGIAAAIFVHENSFHYLYPKSRPSNLESCIWAKCMHILMYKYLCKRKYILMEARNTQFSPKTMLLIFRKTNRSTLRKKIVHSHQQSYSWGSTQEKTFSEHISFKTSGWLSFRFQSKLRVELQKNCLKSSVKAENCFLEALSTLYEIFWVQSTGFTTNAF